MKRMAFFLFLLFGDLLQAIEVESVDDGGLRLSIGRGDSFVQPRPPNAAAVPKETKLYAVPHFVSLTNIGTRELTVPVLPSDKITKPSLVTGYPNGAREEHYRFFFDLGRAPDGGILVGLDQFVTLRPGESVFTGHFLGTADAGGELPKYTVTYEVKSQYADRYQCWSGRLVVTQTPVVVPERAKTKLPKAPEPTPPSVTPRASKGIPN